MPFIDRTCIMKVCLSKGRILLTIKNPYMYILKHVVIMVISRFAVDDRALQMLRQQYRFTKKRLIHPLVPLTTAVNG